MKNVVVEDVFGGELNGYGGDVGEVSFMDTMDSDEEDKDERKEVKDLEVEGWDLGVTYTPRGFKKEVVVDKDGEECAAFRLQLPPGNSCMAEVSGLCDEFE